MFIIRSRPRKKAKYLKKQLLLQHEKLSQMSTFLTVFKEEIKVGFFKKKSKISPMNRAMQYNIDNAFSNTNGELKINYDRIKFCNGNRERAWSEQISFEAGCKINITWDIPELLNLKRIGKDIACILLFNATKPFRCYKSASNIRMDKSISLEMGNHVAGDLFHAWIYFVTPDGKTISDSDYIGSGIVTA